MHAGAVLKFDPLAAVQVTLHAAGHDDFRGVNVPGHGAGGGDVHRSAAPDRPLDPALDLDDAVRVEVAAEVRAGGDDGDGWMGRAGTGGLFGSGREDGHGGPAPGVRVIRGVSDGSVQSRGPAASPT